MNIAWVIIIKINIPEFLRDESVFFKKYLNYDMVLSNFLEFLQLV